MQRKIEMNNGVFRCRICNCGKTNDWSFKEMMFGLRHEFKYKECTDCGCIQIEKYPKEMEDYYPKNYYAFTERNFNQLQGIVEKAKSSVLLYNHLVFKDFMGRMGKKTLASFQYNLQYLESVNLKPWSRILDVGCANGSFLSVLYHMGFSNLTGIDKFIPEDFVLFNKVPLWKKGIDDLTKKFDVITLHHVFEHMPDQKNVLASLYNKLNKKGTVIIRIPVKNKAWEIYGEHWVQIDAPRHFYLHTINSFKFLAESAGFAVTKIEFDSYGFQFWGSEQYKLDIPLRNDNRSYAENKQTSIFTLQQLSDWENTSLEFNCNNLGDQAIFFLKKNE